ncbi:MAG: hypothetical protein IJB73_07410 [Firmicutes bacterium]|nr:hypothetical protein [Bacillota bacterium]
MKKLLVLLLIFVLSFSVMGCGGNNEDTTQPDDENTPVIGEDENAGDDEEGGAAEEDGENEDLGRLDVEDLYMSEDDGKVLVDLGLKADKSFPMEGTLAKVDYSDLEGSAATLENMLITSTEELFNKAYVTYKEYEVYEGDEIDKLAYAVGMEDNDSEKCYLEVGAYHNSVKNNHYQYSIFTSDSLYEVSDDIIETAILKLETAYGIKVSEKKAKEMLTSVIEEAKDMEFAAVYDEATVKGSGYTETVWFGVEAFSPEEGETGYYFSVERERCYN